MNIPTAVTGDEIQELQRLAAGGFVLEIGSLLGFSTIQLAMVADRVVSIDPHEGYPENDPKPTLHQFLSNLRIHGVRDKVSVCVGTDEDFLGFFDEEAFDLVFIDAMGTYHVTKHIMDSAWRLVSLSGYMAVHDVGHPDWPGAGQAVTEFCDHYKLPYQRVGTLATFNRNDVGRG